MKKIKVVSCVVTLAVMALIFFFSAQTAEQSSTVSSGIARKIAECAAKLLNAESADTILKILNLVIRKLAHFALFFLLGISASNTGNVVWKLNGIKHFLLTMLFCVLYAISDEIHQLFVPGRAAMLQDVLIDSVGAAGGCAVYMLVRLIYLRGNKNGM